MADVDGDGGRSVSADSGAGPPADVSGPCGNSTVGRDLADWTSRDATRGVSTSLGYVLNLGVAAILVTTLLLAAGTLVDDQRDRAVETELRVVGDRVAADLEAADRLARASDDGTVRYAVEAPTDVAGTAYDVRVNESGDDRVVLVADRSGVTVSVAFYAETTVDVTTQRGGDLVVVYDSDADTLEVEDA